MKQGLLVDGLENHLVKAIQLFHDHPLSSLKIDCLTCKEIRKINGNDVNELKFSIYRTRKESFRCFCVDFNVTLVPLYALKPFYVPKPRSCILMHFMYWL